MYGQSGKAEKHPLHGRSSATLTGNPTNRVKVYAEIWPDQPTAPANKKVTISKKQMDTFGDFQVVVSLLKVQLVGC